MSTKDDGFERRVKERLPSTHLRRLVSWLPTWLEIVVVAGTLFSAGATTALWTKGLIQAPTLAAQNGHRIDALKAEMDTTSNLLAGKIALESQRLDVRIDSIKVTRIRDNNEFSIRLADVQNTLDRMSCVIEAEAQKQSLVHCGLH